MTELESVGKHQNSPKGRVEAEVTALCCAASNLWKMRMANDTADHVIDAVGEIWGALGVVAATVEDIKAAIENAHDHAPPLPLIPAKLPYRSFPRKRESRL